MGAGDRDKRSLWGTPGREGQRVDRQQHDPDDADGHRPGGKNDRATQKEQTALDPEEVGDRGAWKN